MSTVHNEMRGTVAPPTPHQLPPLTAAFTERDEDTRDVLAGLDRLAPDAVRLVVVSGDGGVGKTAFASHLLHAIAAQYPLPGGQLYADLRAYSPDGPAPMTDVLGQLLRSLLPEARPVTPQELGTWWRSASAAAPNGPMGMLIDDASCPDQVRELLPGGRGDIVVVTSRQPMPALAADGAVLHHLGALNLDSVLQYLTTCLGERRILREPQAARALAELCAGIPLALGVVVRDLAAHPERPLANLATALSLHHDHVHTAQPTLPPPETALMASLDTAYWAQDPEAAAVYRRMASLPLANLDAAMVSAACDLPRQDATRLLTDLQHANLLQVLSDADDPVRGRVYAFHDKAGDHARAHARAETTAGEYDEALRRLLDFLLATATAAERRLTPAHRRLDRDYAYPPAEPVQLPDDAAATMWLDGQRRNLWLAIRAADAAGFDRPAYQLAHAIWPLLRDTHDYEMWLETQRIGYKAALQCQDRVAQRELLGTLGLAYRSMGSHHDAERIFAVVQHSAENDPDGPDHRSRAQMFHERGSNHLDAGQPVRAYPYLLQARQLRADLGEATTDTHEQMEYRRAVALSDICLAQVDIELGHPGRAILRLTLAFEFLPPDPLDAARALAWRGCAYAAAGQLDQAIEDGQAAITMCDGLNSPCWKARSREMLGQTFELARQLDKALPLYEEAIALYSAISPRDEERVHGRLHEARSAH